MDYRAKAAHKLRISLGFKKYDVILSKEQLILLKTKGLSKEENMKTQSSISSYRIE